MAQKALAIGVTYVGYGDYAGTGVPATEYLEVEEIHKGSVAFNFSDSTQIKIEIEKTEDPRWIINRKGDADSIEFAIASPSTDELIAFAGGTKTNDKWNAPDTITPINKTIKLMTEPYQGKYVEYVMVNGSISAKLSQAPGKEQTDLLLVKVTRQLALDAAGVLQPSFSREVVTVTPPTV